MPLLPPLPPLFVIVHVVVPLLANNLNVFVTEELPLTVNVPSDVMLFKVNK